MFAKIFAAHPDAELAALCDRGPERLKRVTDAFEDLRPTRCASFEQLLGADIDAVVLADDATGHAPLAVAALEAGKHVLSEVPACSTMAEAVRLVEAVERSSALYMMAENYCFRPAATEIGRQFAAGDLGEFQHGEGEYVHDTEEIWPQLTRGNPDHWRNWRTSTLYCTLSLLYVTCARVTRVVAMETPNRIGHRYGRLHGDSAVLICQTSNNGTIKSLQSHGGLRREPPSTWLALYGTRGSMETFLQAVLGRCPVPIDVYKATDMSVPGLLGFRSIFQGNVPYDVPDLRERTARDQWRDDRWAVRSTNAGVGEPEGPSSFHVPSNG